MLYLDRPLAITDLETSGLNPRHCEILEVGLVLVNRRNWEVLGKYTSKVKPTFTRIIEPDEEASFDFRSLARGEKVAFRKALDINGYVEDEWRDAPPLESVLTDYVVWTDGAVFTSHNTTFDWGFMDVGFEEAGVKHTMDYHRPDLFTRSSEILISKDVELPKYSLDSLAKYFYLGEEAKPHRALRGAELAFEIFKAVSAL